MAITKINSVLVKHGKFTFAIITIIIIIAFVWFFTPGISGNIFLDNHNSPSSKVGEVFGETVTLGQVNQAVTDIMLIQAMQVGIDPSREHMNISMQNAFMFAAGQVLARKFGIAVPESEVGIVIRSMPAFKDREGNFSREKYLDYEKKFLLPHRYNLSNLENAVRAQLGYASISRVLGAAPLVTKGELDSFLRSSLEKYTVHTVLFKNAAYRPAAPAEKDILAYFNANQKAFQTPARFNAEVVRFNYSAYGQNYTPSAAEIKQFYDSNKAAFGKQPLAAVSGKIAEDMKKARAAAEAEKAAVAFREKLYAATDKLDAANHAAFLNAFRKVAAAEKLHAAATGWFYATDKNIPGVGEDPEFSAAIADTAKRTPITSPIEGKLAFFVAAVTGFEPSRPAKYGEVKDKVRAIYVESKASEAARAAMRNFKAKLADPKNAGKLLSSFDRNAVFAAVPEFNLAEQKNVEPAVVFLARQTPNGKLSEAVPVPDGVMAVFVDRRTPPTAAEMEKFGDQARLSYQYVKGAAVSSAFQYWLAANINHVFGERGNGESAE